MTSKKTPDFESYDQYLDAGDYTLIPLHKWNKRSTHKGKERDDGKRPKDFNWTTRGYDSADTVAEARKQGTNVGVRLTASQLVVDVDPRNMPEGRDTFAELCEATGLIPDEYPCVKTGSGGLHVYMTKDPKTPVMDSLDGYQGVEFKTKGRQVVAAGSIHPNGTQYEWDFLAPDLSEAEPAPKRLMGLIKRPERKTSGVAGGGEYDQIEIAKMLDGLDPMHFSGTETVHGVDWLTLMMAVHHASNGDARDEWIEWCTRDPDYGDDAWIIGRRWDSLHREAPDGAAVTAKTLEHVLLKEGKDNLIPRPSADDDFGDDEVDPQKAEDKEFDAKHKTYEITPGDQEDVPEHEKVGPMERMNRRFWAVRHGGKFRIMEDWYNPVLGRNEWINMSKQAFCEYLANRKIEKGSDGNTKLVNLGEAWLEWKDRREADGVVFDPENDHPNVLNLWTGWGVEPRVGTWDYTKELIHEVLCGGDDAGADFVMKWLAYMVQNPGVPPEVAICFRGDKGTGKSTLGEALVHMSGRHGLHVTSPKQVTGDFNSHLMECIFLFADEAVAPRDHKAQAALKSLITDRHKTYEAKGVDLVQGINRVHVMMASNDDWFVDATEGERRYYVSEVSNIRQQNTTFFRKLKHELYQQGGVGAMLHDLKTLDLGKWEPRGNIPASTALTDQKLRNLEPVPRWWFNLLDGGDFGSLESPDGNEGEWLVEGIKMFRQDLRENYGDFCKSSGMRAQGMNKSMERYFWAELGQICPGMEVKRQVRARVPDERFDIQASASDGRANGIIVPDLLTCRQQFENWIGGTIEWN